MPRKVKTPAGEIDGLYWTMTKEPHVLIAGATGSGKSVVINGIIHALLHLAPGQQADGVEMILIDPKRVELIRFKPLPHTILYASEPGEFFHAFMFAFGLIESRYKDMQRHHERVFSGGDAYIIIDEWADLILSRDGKKIIELVQRIAQIGRAARVHIIAATQTPIAKVLPTEIKCNFDARLGLRTRSAQDSRNIIGVPGLETLPRYGQGVYMSPNLTGLTDLTYWPDAEFVRLFDHWGKQYKRKFKYD